MYKYKNLQAGQVNYDKRICLFCKIKFIITKYLKQEVDDNLSICVDERRHCGLSITVDKKIYQCDMIKR